MAEEVKERVDLAGIPSFTGSLGALEKDVAGLKKDANAIRKTGAGVHSGFQGLSAYYEAPEAEQLFATTRPVRDRADDFAGDLEKVATALSGYATEVRPLVAKLNRLRSEAASFVSSIRDDDDWREDGDKVDQNNDLIRDISETVAQFWAAERRCANKITALVGGTQWVQDDGSGEQRHAYGLSVEDMKQAGETPWGKAVEQEYPFWRADQHIKSFVWDGIVIDGIWGTVKGLGALFGDNAGEAWKGLGKLATGLALVTVPGGMAAPELMPDGAVKDWMTDSRTVTMQTGKELVAWDTWSENPARAAGLVAFNVLTTVGTGGAGLATKAGTAGKVASAAGKVGTAIDPMTYIGKGVGAGVKSLPKISDITTGLKGVSAVEAIELPNGNLHLPDGRTLNPDGPIPELPPGTQAVVVKEGTPTIPKGSVIYDADTILTPNGTIIDSTGALKQPAHAAPSELTAADRATLDTTDVSRTPDTPTREPALTGAQNTPTNTTAHLGDGPPGTPANAGQPGPGGTAPEGPTASVNGPGAPGGQSGDFPTRGTSGVTGSSPGSADNVGGGSPDSETPAGGGRNAMDGTGAGRDTNGQRADVPNEGVGRQDGPEAPAATSQDSLTAEDPPASDPKGGDANGQASPEGVPNPVDDVPANGLSNRDRPPREGDTDYVVDNPENWADTITDIDRVEDGVLWEEKTATGQDPRIDADKWTKKHVLKKLDAYARARPHLQGFEDAPIGIHFTEAGATPAFKSAVEKAVDAWRAKNPGAEVIVRWTE